MRLPRSKWYCLHVLVPEQLALRLCRENALKGISSIQAIPSSHQAPPPRSNFPPAPRSPAVARRSARTPTPSSLRLLPPPPPRASRCLHCPPPPILFSCNGGRHGGPRRATQDPEPPNLESLQLLRAPCPGRPLPRRRPRGVNPPPRIRRLRLPGSGRPPRPHAALHHPQSVWRGATVEHHLQDLRRLRGT